MPWPVAKPWLDDHRRKLEDVARARRLAAIKPSVDVSKPATMDLPHIANNTKREADAKGTRRCAGRAPAFVVRTSVTFQVGCDKEITHSPAHDDPCSRCPHMSGRIYASHRVYVALSLFRNYLLQRARPRWKRRTCACSGVCNLYTPPPTAAHHTYNDHESCAYVNCALHV